MKNQQAARDRKAYRLAREFLLSKENKDRGVTEELLEKHLRLEKKPGHLNGLYQRLLHSATNANMVAGVIDGGIGSVDKLGPLLCAFNPKATLHKYGCNSSHVLKDIRRRLKPKGKFRRSKKSIWPKFCRTILSAAEFMTKFDSAEDFYTWLDAVSRFDKSWWLPAKIISENIYGIGPALACDFLKGLGYARLGKPDVHIRNIFVGLRLSKSSKEIDLLVAIQRIGDNVPCPPYSVDKVFWLVGSGKFYLSDVRIGKKEKKFIKWARKQLVL
jgi:hypothetical protein